MTEGVVRSLGSGRFLDWGAMGAQGSAGGILVCWDKRSLELWRWRKGEGELWEELGAIRGIWDEPWCIGGDFNVTLSQRIGADRVALMEQCVGFAQVVDDLALIDLPLQGGVYSWSGGRNNRLGRDWIVSWYPRGGGMSRGPSPFRFENMWLKVDGFKELLREWWQEGKEVEVNKSLALQQIEFWDRVESGRDLSERETNMKNEAKENFKKWEVREGIVKAFQHQLREEPGWRADLEGLHLKSLDHSEAEALEVPFTEEEIFAALMDMNGDKAPGPDGFTVAFWQACWDFAKEEIVELFKELYDQKSFAKSLNATFLVIIQKKNAFVRGRQILDASLIANEVVDYWQKRKEKGLVCKLDIEKAYDSISWSFLMKVLKKMGFGSRWMDWMWWCFSRAKFSVLINGAPAGFFSSSKGLRQGDPISPYLFILGMEVLSALIRRAVQGNFISGCRLRGRGDAEIMVSHLLFADDTIIFYEASKDQVTHLGWILAWFEAASGLRINLAKSELIPVGEIDNVEEMAVELGCRIGSFPVKYLGLPLGARHKALPMWDGVEDRMRRRLARWKRQYLSKGGRITLIKRGNTGRKIHLVNWKVVCTQKEKGGLGIRRMGPLNKALLGKWIWRFAVEKEVLWKKVIGVKHGLEDGGWKSKEARGPIGVGVWKEILKEMGWCWNNMKFKVGGGIRLCSGLITGAEMKRCPKRFPRFSPWQHAEMHRWMRCGTRGLAKEGGISV
ncbi:LINE-1 reverse transcriptase-like [Vitis vinifera]|uniref:LINE-1 reverse transcriptase-like n=1 Tax=Vitis vinifera TaxID=29760 RepID=A0A438GIB8_VITVI|nr:LINE-1 reverse transcriptase-like [Vitis vinifera]